MILKHLFSEVSRDVDSFGAFILRVGICGLGRLTTPAGRFMILVIERLRWSFVRISLLLLLNVTIVVLVIDHHLLPSKYVAAIVTTTNTNTIQQQLLFAGEVAGEERAAILKGLVLGSHDDHASIATFLLLLLTLNFLFSFLGQNRYGRRRHRRRHLCPESHQAERGGHDSRRLTSAAVPHR